MRGTGRAAALKNARPKTEEMQAQEISNIAMGLNVAFAVPRATRHPWTHPKHSLQPTSQTQPHSQGFSWVPGTDTSISSVACCDLCLWRTTE